MKLLSCYVSSFGKLKNFSYTFNGGLNTFNEQNGWGKSTLATFIKAMFYGINSSKRSIAENERIKFKPWNSTEMFGGHVCFEWGGNEYKIERFFGAKESEDTVRLFDIKSGKEFSNTENLGKRIFEIDEEGFLSTTYFSQKDFQIKSNTSLTAKYNSVCEIQDTEAFDKALLKLEEKAKQYKYRGDKGAISDVKNAIFGVDENIDKAIRASQAVKALTTEVDELSHGVKCLKEQAGQLAEKIERAGQYEAQEVKKARQNELLSEKAQLEREIKKADQVLNGRIIDDSELYAFNECYNQFLSASASVNSAKEEIQRLKFSREENAQEKNRKSNKKPFFIGGLTLLIIGAVFAFFCLPVAIVSFVLSAVAFIMPFVIKNKGSNKNEELYFNLLSAQEKKRDDYLLIQSEYKEKLNLYLSKFNLPPEYDFAKAFDLLKELCLIKRGAIIKIERLNAMLKEYESDAALTEKMEKIEDATSLRRKLSEVQKEYAKKAEQLAEKLALVKAHQDFANRISDFESEKAELVERLSQYKAEYEILTLTIDYLKKADANLKTKYRAPLQQSLNKYVGYLDGQKSNVKIDVDLTVSVEEPSGERSTEYYSKGYQNLFEICKRFALTDVLFTGEKPFIILDDPFYNLDAEKIDSALNLLEKLSLEYQIIYFVCHESRSGKNRE